MPKKITPEEAIVLRDEESKDYFDSKILRDKNGKAKLGKNGDPLLQDTTAVKDGKKVGFQITLND